MTSKQNTHLSLDIRIGKIISVEMLADSKYATHHVRIDFGELGIRTSIARLVRYKENELIGKVIVAVVNLPPKKIGGLMSDALLLGTPNASGDCILLVPDNADEAILGELAF